VHVHRRHFHQETFPMRTPIVLSCTVLALNVGLAFSLPQTSASGATAPQMRSPDQVVERMNEKLNLTDQQKAQITPIIAERQQKMLALRADTSERRPARARNMKGIMHESDEKIEAVLNPDQKRKYEAMEQQMRAQAKQRMEQQRQSPQ
jgi:periplasmic protein CpxP/Spy